MSAADEPTPDESERLRREDELRRRFARSIFGIISLWLLFIAGLLVYHATGRPSGLSDPVLIAVLGTTTVSVIGLLAIVARYLFPLERPTRRRTRRAPKSRGRPRGRRRLA